LKQKIYLIVFTYLAFLPHTAFFPNIYWSFSYYLAQVVFGIMGVSFLRKFKFDFKIAFPWMLFGIAFLFSSTGILFKSVYFEISTLGSYLNGIFLIFNSAILFVVINKFSREAFDYWIRFFHFFVFICLLIGSLQFFDLIIIEGARTNANIDISGLPFTFQRATSIFSEPSAWAHLYGIYCLLGYYLGYNWKIILITLISLFLSVSNSGFVFVFIIFVFSLFRKPITKFKLVGLLIFVFGTIGLIIALQPYLDLVFSKFTDGDSYRNIAPLMVIKSFFSQFDIKMIFGHGIFSLKYITTKLDLPEYIPTSHNSYVDILFELGVFGLLCQLFLLLKTFGHNILLTLLMIILLSQIGYRSYQYPLIFLIYAIYVQTKRHIDFK
jgi:hypothetical protein